MAASSPALCLVLLCLCATSAVAGFTCNSTGSAATCRSLVGFQPFNATTYGAVQALFQVPALAALAGANGLPLSTLPSAAVAANSTVLVPIPCRCVNGTGRSDRTPVYTVRAGDAGLYDISYFSFGNLIQYQEIVTVNELPDANNITVGEQLWIPLPCSCDAVGAEAAAVVHLAHRVAALSSLEGIASEFGTTEATLMALNGISDPKTLQADQILDVPLQACSSSISSTSLDYNFMRLANDSYALTANGCVQCSCSSNTYKLECYQTRSNSLVQCETSTCPGNLSIGNTTSSSCDKTTCSYAGFANSSSLTVDVKTIAVNQSTCSSDGSPPHGSKVFMWTVLLILLNVFFFSLK